MANSRSWSIYGNAEITKRYEILERVGYGTYADVYRARRRIDGLTVALKEIHDYQSAYREIEALRLLGSSSPNVVSLLEFFWNEDDDAVLVLEYLPTDLATVIDEAKRRRSEGGEGIPVGETKRWMFQILEGVRACHENSVVHRDLKPANLLISAEGILKLADFGQSRILQEPTFSPCETNPEDGEGQDPIDQVNHLHVPVSTDANQEQCQHYIDATAEDVKVHAGASSFDDPCAPDYVNENSHGPCTYSEEVMEGNWQNFTSCVGTRWYRAPELLYGSTNYGVEIDLWSVGCIFAELLILEPLFPGNSDIDQLAKIISTLGNVNEETWPGCSALPDYGKISFKKIKTPQGLNPCLPNRLQSEVCLVQRLICYDPRARATAAELMQDNYFREHPLPLPISELNVPSTRNIQESTAGDWDDDWKDFSHDSDREEFSVNFTDKGFSIRFS